ncbi:MAG TPA: zinc metallopeptidase [Firmicutes bacterium]|nr:zinc metallopeptidase [Bacillales bacterium]HJA40546.1 zinc metallopeptidase [Bacillota bacterium]
MGMIIYFVIILLLPLYAQFKVKGTYKKYDKVHGMNGYTGAEVARMILDRNGLRHVRIEETPGVLSDHYDPSSKVVRLSSGNYHGTSLAGVAVAAHEVGHAIQDAEGYAYLRFRHALVPVANWSSNLSWIFIMIGLFASLTNMLLLGIILMAAGVLFQIVTLPVEFNASSRAMRLLTEYGLITSEEAPKSRKVLSAAAFTYVAGAMVAVAELVRLLLIYVGQQED